MTRGRIWAGRAALGYRDLWVSERGCTNAVRRVVAIAHNIVAELAQIRLRPSNIFQTHSSSTPDQTSPISASDPSGSLRRRRMSSSRCGDAGVRCGHGRHRRSPCRGSRLAPQRGPSRRGARAWPLSSPSWPPPSGGDGRQSSVDVSQLSARVSGRSWLVPGCPGVGDVFTQRLIGRSKPLRPAPDTVSAATVEVSPSQE